MTNNFKSLIVIPARYASSRLPGKPLVMIAGKTLLQRVCEIAQQAAQQFADVGVLVATDDERILNHAQDLNILAVMTPYNCPTGTDRILSAINNLGYKPKNVVNLQGDSPLTPVHIITSLLSTLEQVNEDTVVTPIIQLSWEQLDLLRQTKLNNPFSGTTVIVNKQDEALWFSKQIIPALRSETKLRQNEILSPIYQHLGIYAYPTKILEKFSQLPKGVYEQLEELEQLRLLENGYKIKTVKILLDDLSAWRGVDTADDAKLVEQIILGTR